MTGQHVEPSVPQQRSRAPGSSGTLGWLSGGPIHLAVTEALRAPGKIPGCSGTRNLHDNLSDLRAQVAANQKGIQLVGELIGQYGLDVVQAYMGHIQVCRAAARAALCSPPGRWAEEEGAPGPPGRGMADAELPTRQTRSSL